MAHQTSSARRPGVKASGWLCAALCGLCAMGARWSVQAAPLRLPDWVRARPTYALQASPALAQRGLNPCNIPDLGYGSYAPWRRIATDVDLLMPKELTLGRHGEFSLVFHFHGREAARKQLVQELTGVVIVGMDLGNGSSVYHGRFSDPRAFAELVALVEDKVAAATGSPLGAAKAIGLSAWSAGYGAVAAILSDEHSRARIDSVVLLDALHADYINGEIEAADLEPFVDFARAAASGDRLMFITHSAITPPHYASTTETANYLVWSLGGRPQSPSFHQDPLGLARVGEYHNHNFHVLGYAGGTAPDHCAQFGALPQIAKSYLGPRLARAQ